MAIIYLILSFFAAAQDPTTQKLDSAQVDALARQISSELLTAVQYSNIGNVDNDPTGEKASLRYNVHMSDCENRWVALYRNAEDPNYTYGFVYIDPQAGFTFHYFGRFMIDDDANYHMASNPFPPDKASLKIRLEKNGIAALLPARALEQLQLPDKPEWLKYYEDDADPITHKVNWGFFYNALGDSRRALDYLESAYKEQPDAPRVVFELTYAYNAAGRPSDAIRVAKTEFTKNPKDELLCREIAFAYIGLKRYSEATPQYQSCIALCADSETGMAEKSELAMNLSAAYGALSDTANRDTWLEKAKNWAPKKSAVYKHFHPGEE
jgi:tetratricopeptide (TPR) repeat protein